MRHAPAGSQVLFRLRRPAYLINSSMFVEDGEGNVVGEIQQRWHALRRNYDLYINKSQFAAISGERAGGLADRVRARRPRYWEGFGLWSSSIPSYPGHNRHLPGVGV